MDVDRAGSEATNGRRRIGFAAAVALSAIVAGCATPWNNPDVPAHQSAFAKSPRSPDAAAKSGEDPPNSVTTLPGTVVTVASSQVPHRVGETRSAAYTDAILPAPLVSRPESSPIDLPTALRLGGANNIQIALAVERLRQAEARLDGANALWLPSVNVGAGYSVHTGRIQDTTGQIIDVDRQSVFVGGGPVVGGFPLPGGAGPPPRLFMGLPLADAVFTRLAERQVVAASQAETAVTMNDTLLRIGLAYLDLVAAHQQVAISRDTLANAKELDRLVDSRVKAGAALAADGLRAKAELADRERQLQRADENARVASTELVRLLRLDPTIQLVPAESQPAPIELVSPDTPLTTLIEQGLTQRPELAHNQALVRATLERMRLELWRPWIPSIALGYSGGKFGGGSGSDVGRFGGRSDFEAVAAWEVRNLGFGNRALQRQQESLLAQANMTAEQTRDNILAEITRAHHQVRFRKEQVDAARRQLTAATEALPLNFRGVISGNLRAIEALQAVQALATAQTQFLSSVTEYNQAQFQLLRAIGRPLESGVAAPGH